MSAAPLPDGQTWRRRRGLSVLGILVFSLSLGVWRLWTSDDGFITMRVARQIAAGNGPVFNRGERVEASTSPLWTHVVALLDVINPQHLEISVAVVSLLICNLGILLVLLAHMRHMTPGPSFLVPGGLIILFAMQPFADFQTSGLDTSLSLLWVGFSWWALGRERSALSDFWVAVLLGGSVLVRAELIIPAGVMLVYLLRGRSRTSRLLTVATFAMPVIAIELFRAVYFASFVPNTALAKEGSTIRWDMLGLSYLTVFVFLTGMPLIIAAHLISRRWAILVRHPLRTVAWLGALLLTGYVVAVGGDYMNGRLLLPGLLLAVAPYAAIQVDPHRCIRPAATLSVGFVSVWLIQSVGLGRQAASFDFSHNTSIVDERAYVVHLTKNAHPLVRADFIGSPYAQTPQVFPMTGVLVLRDGTVVPLANESAPSVVEVFALGVNSYVLPLDTFVVDDYGLADPVAGRLRLTVRGRSGHEKLMPTEITQSRFGIAGHPQVGVPETPTGSAFCRRVARLYRDIREPITWSSAWRHIEDAWSNSRLRFDLSSVDGRCLPGVPTSGEFP